MSTVKKIKDFGQSIWYDNIRRDLLQSGAFDKMVQDDGVTGLTSNPSIFHQAIAGTSLYDSAIKELGHHGLSAYEIYEQIAIDDLRAAADILAPVYMQTNRTDSYVSLEVSPNLAHDTEGTILEARLLFTRVGRPNLMIKIPATEEGIPAIEELIENGINVNVTLLFSVERYEQVVEAYLKGLERRLAAGHPIDSVSSVASFFVSRVDTAMDKLIEERLKDPNHHQILEELLGQTAIANAKIAYLHS